VTNTLAVISEMSTVQSEGKKCPSGPLGWALSHVSRRRRISACYCGPRCFINGLAQRRGERSPEPERCATGQAALREAHRRTT